MVLTLASVRKSRSELVKEMATLAVVAKHSAEQTKRWGELETEIADLGAQIGRMEKALELSVATAQPVAGQEPAQEDGPFVQAGATKGAPARVETDPYVQKGGKSLQVGAIAKMIGAGGGVIRNAVTESKHAYGENHPVTRALIAGSGTAGGFIIPPDYMNEIIELLRPIAVVRGSGPRVIPMPRGTMTLPGQASPASATYTGEVAPLGVSQQTLNQIVASYKKLTALVPVSNDLMRYADPAVDAFVRDDLVKVLALREDLAFLTGNGTVFGPSGFTQFAGQFAINGSFYVPGGGTAAIYNVGSASTWGTGGNYVTSNPTYTLATAASELGGLVNKLDTANVTDMKRTWFMHPRSFNYLNNVQNSLGVYVYRDELSKGTLLGYPFKKTTQLPVNIEDPTTAYTDCSFIILAEMPEAMILDSMQLELAVSRDGTYIDASGNTQSAFSNDQTLIRAIAEHDFQLRHDASVAILQGVRWAPAIS